jgi:DNA-directed RNA polymerase beta subunit
LGNIYDDGFMPYFSDGIIPDMIFNIHSLCKRKTTATLLEGLVTHYAIHKCKIIDGTAF